MGGTCSSSSRSFVEIQENDGRPLWFTVDYDKHNAEEVIFFDKSQSQVVCIGIDEFLHPVHGLEPLGEGVINDSHAIGALFREKFEVPASNIQVINGSQNTLIPTKENILHALTKAAKNASENGIIVFQYSGHASSLSGEQAVLIPADCHGNIQTTLTANEIGNCFKKAKCKFVVMILDCCYSGKVGQLLIPQLAKRSSVPVFVLSSCTSIQRSLSHRRLHHGVYTYFLLESLKDYVTLKAIPVHHILDFTKNTISAFCRIVQGTLDNVDDSSELMTPLVMKTRSRVEEDAVDAVKEVDVLWKFRNYLKQAEIRCGRKFTDSDIPDKAWSWLRGAVRNMEVLYCYGCLKKSFPESRLFEAVLLTTIQSLCRILSDDANKDLFEPCIFLVLFIRVSEDMVNYFKLIPTLPDLLEATMLFTHTIATRIKVGWTKGEPLYQYIRLVALLRCHLKALENGDIATEHQEVVWLDGRVQESIESTEYIKQASVEMHEKSTEMNRATFAETELTEFIGQQQQEAA